MNALRFIKRVWQALPLSDYNRWRVTVLLLEPILPLIKGSVVANAYLREKDWQTKRIRPFHGDALPDLPSQNKADVFFWGVIDWRFRIQRPQHLATGFSYRGYRVFYISTSFVNTGKPGFEIEQMDSTGRLWNVRLHVRGRPRIYTSAPSTEDYQRLMNSLASLLEWSESKDVVSIVQHPYWHEVASKLPHSFLAYDCMDHHDGFGNTGVEINLVERQLLMRADAVVTTSQWLYDFALEFNNRVALIRNAVDYNYFATEPDHVFHDSKNRRVLGYYGAIAEWMDLELLAQIARTFSNCLLLLVGADECGAGRYLTGLSNVLLTGEVKYTELTHYLYGMDVCLLPFRVTPLTVATNPVKLYEYLAAGKAVVATDLPELAQFDGLVATADNHERFVSQINEALSNLDAAQEQETRQGFANQNTWDHRVTALEQLILSVPRPSVAIIVVTFNNLKLTRICLDSLAQFSECEWVETIVVDNASSDGTPDYLINWESSAPRRRAIFNSSNRGFAAANNQGLATARADYLVMLNNDTQVTADWLMTMVNHLRFDKTIGMLGPVTNNIGNEAKIKIRYQNSADMHRKARRYTLAHAGQLLPIRTLAFFCVMLPRTVYEQVGPLDEAFGLGFFEDDDYCRRVEKTGLRLMCAEDVFIHHELSASFNKLGKDRQALLEKNRKIYEAKWGPWTPHRRR